MLDAASKSYKRLLWRMSIVCGFFLCIFAFLITLAFPSNFAPMNIYNGIFLLIFLLLALKCASFLKRLYSLMHGGATYVPGKRFYLFRLDAARRIILYKRFRFLAGGVLLAIVVLAVIKGNLNALVQRPALLICLLGYIGALSRIISQIKYHTRLDDTSAFELEDLGLITENDIVTALYKDFSSWDEVKKDSKLLLLTQDELVILIFSSRTHARKYSIRLSKIERLEIIRNTRWLGGDSYGFLFSARAGNEIFKFALLGESYQDSPEEFFRQLLLDLDTVRNNAKRSIAKRQKEQHTVHLARTIEIEDTTTDTMSGQTVGTTRVIDF
jgi:hypothetical protein